MTALEGIIVRTYPSSEADLMLRIISRSEGKVSLLAKHARKSTKRFAGGLDVFDRGVFQTARSRSNVPVLASFSAGRPFGSLREDLDKLTLSSLLCECFDFMVQEDATGAGAVYEALEKGLESLAAAVNLREALRACHHSISRLLVLSGFLAGNQDDPASPRSLLSMLSRIETCAERKLACRTALNELLAAFQRDAHV